MTRLRVPTAVRDERGMTVAELMVTLALLGLIVTLFSLVLASVQVGTNRQIDRSNDNDQARLAVQQLDRDIRSGNLLYDPSVETPPYYALRVYTQSFADVHNPGNRCVEWRLVDGVLQRRDWAISWATNPAGLVSPWRVVATNVANLTLPQTDANADGVPDPALFRLDSDPLKGQRTLIVQVFTQTDAGSGRPVEIEASITGRNTSYGYPTEVCASVPPSPA